MRVIRIDFTQNNYPIFAGYVGEHNATEIIAEKPSDLVGTTYSFAFMTNGEVCHSKMFSADEELRVSLWQQITQDYELGVQLEAYDEDGNYLGKSSVATLGFGVSVHGTDVVADDENSDVYSDIALNTAMRKTLEDNVDTLDKLSTSVNGTLLFDGKVIEGGGGSANIDIDVAVDTEDEYKLKISTDTETITTSNLKGKQGVSGVYVGEGEMPDGYNVQIDPSGEEIALPEDGFSPIVDVTEIEGGHRVTVTDAEGTETFDVLDGTSGADGADGYTPIKGVDYFDGEKGADGTSITISSVSESTESGGSNVVTFSDGKTLTIKNGTKGEQGEQGIQGEKGADGYTPVKGTDYWTDKDKTEMVDDVVAEMGIDIVPDYVIEEAERVLDKVIEVQTDKTFTFAAITDLHYGNAGYTDGVKHACQAMKYIDERIKLDAVAVLGDYTDGYPAEGFDNAIGDFKTINSVLSDLRFAPNLRTQGNHDYYADHTSLVNRFIQSFSDDVVWGSKSGGYFYRDFEDYELRIICVNTTETGNANIGCSDEQYEWFASSLDLSSKTFANRWQILILSHHPLDWYTTDSTYRFAYILEAYKNGTSGTVGGISYDFTDKNSATLIGNIHGHIHNLLTDYINKGNINTSNPTSVIRMCTPEACINRSNQYESWAEDTSYPKTINTAEDTSFVVYCIDLDSNVINAICYGAGYDRELNYLGSPIVYSVTNNLTNVTTDNPATQIQQGEMYLAFLKPTEGDIVSVSITMGGEDITANSFSNNTVIINAVFGDIVITASAKEEEPETTYTNQIPISVDTDGNVYNGIGYKNDYRLNSSGTESAQAGSSVTGFIPIMQNNIVYLKNIALTSGIDSTNQYIRIYDDTFAHIGGCKTNAMSSNTWLFADVTTDSDTGYITSFRLTNGLGDDPAYLRISANTFDSTAVITINEPIE